MYRYIFEIYGLEDKTKASELEEYLDAVSGINSANISFEHSRGIVSCYESVTKKDIKDELSRFKYRAHGFRTIKDRHSNLMFVLSCFIILLPIINSLIYLIGGEFNKYVNNFYLQALFGFISAFVCGGGFFIKAIKSLQNKAPGINILISVGIVSPFILSIIEFLFGKTEQYFYITEIIVLLCLIGERIYESQSLRVSAALGDKEKPRIKTCTVIRGDKRGEAPQSEINAGDTVIIKPYTVIPCDGIIYEGYSSINQAAINGDPISVEKKSGDVVYSGSFNEYGTLSVTVSASAEFSTMRLIEKKAEQIQYAKPTSQTLTDRIALILLATVGIVGIAAFIIFGIIMNKYDIGAEKLLLALSFGCPAMMIISAAFPFRRAVIRGLGANVALKNVSAAEKLCSASSFLFSKTGTITYGKPIVTGHNLDDHSLKLAAIAAKNATYPVGIAIYEKFSSKTTPSPEEFHEIDGGGFAAVYEKSTVVIGNKDLIRSCEIVNPYFRDDVIYVAVNKQIRGYITLGDDIKPNASELFELLKKRKKQVAICSCDNRETVETVGKAVGTKSVVSGLTDDEKAELAREMMKTKKLCTIGSLETDCQLLASADTSISTQCENGNVSQFADIVLLNGNIGSIPVALKLSSKYSRTAFRGLSMTAAAAGAMSILAVCGLYSPWVYLIGFGVTALLNVINIFIK